MDGSELGRDELIALMIAELDADLNGRGPVTVLEWPDRSDDVGETVELLARDHGGEVAVEHTRIESYPGQIDDRNAVYQYFDRGGPDLPGMGDSAVTSCWSCRLRGLLGLFNTRGSVVEPVTGSPSGFAGVLRTSPTPS